MCSKKMHNRVSCKLSGTLIHSHSLTGFWLRQAIFVGVEKVHVWRKIKQMSHCRFGYLRGEVLRVKDYEG
jgi:hypothetical protein